MLTLLMGRWGFARARRVPLRSTFLVLAACVGIAPRLAHPCEPSPFAGSVYTGWTSGCVGKLEGVPDVLKAGATFTVEFQVNLGGTCGAAARLFVSHAKPTGPLEGGLHLASTGCEGNRTLYCFGSPQPVPDPPQDDAVVVISDATLHHVEFTVDPGLPENECLATTTGNYECKKFGQLCSGGVMPVSTFSGTNVTGPAAVLYYNNTLGSGWSHVRMIQLDAVTPFKVKRIIAEEESDGRIVPADDLVVAVEIEKTTDATTGPLRLTINDPLLTSDPVDFAAVPAKKGTFTVPGIHARVANESNPDVWSQVIEANGTVALSQIRVDLSWTQEGLNMSTNDEVAVEGSGGAIVYPDYSQVTGEPPTTSPGDPDYFANGNVEYEGAYLDNARIRKWALIGAYSSSGYTPDSPREAAESLARMMLQRMTFKWGTDWAPLALQVANMFEEGFLVPDVPCIGYATSFAAFARVLGLRSRELDVALGMNGAFSAPWSTAVFWMQHALDEVWFDGKWNWFDLGYADAKGLPEAIYDPCFLVTKAPTSAWPYFAIQVYARTGLPIPHEGVFFMDSKTGRPTLERGWSFYFGMVKGCVGGPLRDGANPAPGGLHFYASPSVRMLYTDSRGRRLGAQAPLGPDDQWSPEAPLPLVGEGSVWEVPDALYIAPGTPIVPNELSTSGTSLLSEVISIPNGELTDSFTLQLTAAGDGSYTVVIGQDDAAVADDPKTPPVVTRLHTEEGMLATNGETTRRFTLDRTDPAHLVVSPALAPDAGTPATASDPAPSGCACELARRAGSPPLVWAAALVLLAAGVRRPRRGRGSEPRRFRRQRAGAVLIGAASLLGHGCGASAGGGAGTADAGPHGSTIDAAGDLDAAVPGPSDEPASMHLPDLPFVPPQRGEFTLNPHLGIETSNRHILVGLKDTATVAEANDAIAESGGRLTGTFPEAGILQLEFPPQWSMDVLEGAIERLLTHPAVEAAAEDVPLEDTVVPRPAVNLPAGFDWSWGAPAGANWGLEIIKAPLAWNLAKRIGMAGNPPPEVAVLDAGFEAHPDLAGILEIVNGLNQHSHGTHVAGTIGARWGNGQYVDGVAPYVHIRGYLVNPLLGTTAEDPVMGYGLIYDQAFKAIARTTPRSRVVNISMGYNWYSKCFAGNRCDPRSAPTIPDNGCVGAAGDDVRRMIINQGGLFAATVRALNRESPTLFVVAAGNDSGPHFGSAANPCTALGVAGNNWCSIPAGVDKSQCAGMDDFPAQYSGPWAAAAFHYPDASPHIIIVEALQLDAPGGWTAHRTSFSNVSGNGVFAPGHNIGSTVGAGAGAKLEAWPGTSMATPHVVGAAALLLSIEAELSNAELRKLLTERPYAAMQAGGSSTTATRLDLYAAVLGIDEVHPGRAKSVLSWLADFDDGSLDGFERVVYNATGAFVANNVVDAVGDDKIDLRDFRRFRDEYLLSRGLGKIDGAPDHPKRDLNFDTVIQPGAMEVFPRAALDNCDETLADPAAAICTPTDVDLFAKAYMDAGPDPVQPWSADALEGLLQSADLIVHAESALDALGTDTIQLSIDGASSGVEVDLAPLRDRTVHADTVVLTTPLLSAPKIRWRPVCGGVPKDPEIVQDLDDLTAGEDRVVAIDPADHPPCCGPVITPTSINQQQLCTGTSSSCYSPTGCTGRTITVSAVVEGDSPTATPVYSWDCESVGACLVTGSGADATLTYEFADVYPGCPYGSTSDSIDLEVKVENVCGGRTMTAKRSILATCTSKVNCDSPY